jgi:hypothetical protein
MPISDEASNISVTTAEALRQLLECIDHPVSFVMIVSEVNAEDARRLDMQILGNVSAENQIEILSTALNAKLAKTGWRLDEPEDEVH